MNRINLALLHIFTSLLVLSACTSENLQEKIAKANFDSPPSLLLLLEDNEIGKLRVDQFKELPIDIIYLGSADLSAVDEYKIVYLSADIFDRINAGYLYSWRDSAKLIVNTYTTDKTNRSPFRS